MSKLGGNGHQNILVVAGIIQNRDRILISKRPFGESSPHLWEFPGGKIENGEEPSAALERELREELGIEVEVADIYSVLSVHREKQDIYLLFYWCHHIEGNMPACIEVASWTWAKPEELKHYNFLKADLPLIHRLENQGFPRR